MSRTNKLIEKGSRVVVAGAWRDGRMGLLLGGSERSEIAGMVAIL